MKNLDIDEIRREWSEYSRRVEERTENMVTPEALRRSIGSDARVLRRYGWINLVGGMAIIPFIVWYVAHRHGTGTFFWLFVAGLAVAALFSVYQVVVYHRAGRINAGVVQRAGAVMRYMRIERLLTIAIYGYMFGMLMYMLVGNIFGRGGTDDVALFVRCLVASLAIFAAGVAVSWRIMRWEHSRLQRIDRAARELEEFLSDGGHDGALDGEDVGEGPDSAHASER